MLSKVGFGQIDLECLSDFFVLTGKEGIKMEPENSGTEKETPPKTKKRSPILYGGAGCALGFMIMVMIVVVITLVGPTLPISGENFGTLLNVGSWVLPLGLGVVGYFYGKSKQ
ncbi:MAG: hypothetical protein AB9891_06875 [Anaerolineaceae bacterium]